MKRDNHFLADKVVLRVSHLPKKSPLKVLDCFHGKGVVWENVIRLSQRTDIEVLGIDHKKGKMDEWGLEFDCKVGLKDMDLTNYDIIDLDAYGCPSEELKLIFKSKFIGVIFCTNIQSTMNQLPWDLLIDLGYSLDMCRVAPVLCSKGGWEKVKSWLCLNGVKQITHRSKSKKHYFCFKIIRPRREGHEVSS